MSFSFVLNIIIRFGKTKAKGLCGVIHAKLGTIKRCKPYGCSLCGALGYAQF